MQKAFGKQPHVYIKRAFFESFLDSEKWPWSSVSNGKRVSCFAIWIISAINIKTNSLLDLTVFWLWLKSANSEECEVEPCKAGCQPKNRHKFKTKIVLTCTSYIVSNHLLSVGLGCPCDDDPVLEACRLIRFWPDVCWSCRSEDISEPF